MAVLLWAAVSEASPVKRQNADQTSVAMPRQSGGSAAQAVDEDDEGKWLRAFGEFIRFAFCKSSEWIFITFWILFADEDDDDEVADIEDVLDDDEDDDDDDGKQKSFKSSKYLYWHP